MVPIFLGGLLSYFVERRHGVINADDKAKEHVHRPGTLFSAGLITGEALMGILIAIPIVAIRTRGCARAARSRGISASSSASRCSRWSAGSCIGAARSRRCRSSRPIGEIADDRVSILAGVCAWHAGSRASAMRARRRPRRSRSSSARRSRSSRRCSARRGASTSTCRRATPRHRTRASRCSTCRTAAWPRISCTSPGSCRSRSATARCGRSCWWASRTPSAAAT